MNEKNLFYKAMLMFTDKYAPAADISEATDFITTKDIQESIDNIFPGYVTDASEIVEFLQQEGYTFMPEPGKFNFSLKWMLIRKTQ